jgi:ABC-type Fe3+-hydroxamate transport system substrate-binding protein
MILNNPNDLHEPPKRIISLVPSQTEFLYDLGLHEETVGITRFCVHPPHWKKEKVNIGGTKDLRMDRIHALKPDLIIANKEENNKVQVEELAEQYPVWVTNVQDCSTALDMMKDLGILTNRVEASNRICQEIQITFYELNAKQFKTVRTAYLIWRNPWMSIGKDTYINDMMRRAGLDNVFGDKTRYPSFEWQTLQDLAPELVMLSSEPYPFRELDIDFLQQSLPDSKVVLVDGEAFSWYGSRMLHGTRYLLEWSERWRA